MWGRQSPSRPDQKAPNLLATTPSAPTAFERAAVLGAVKAKPCGWPPRRPALTAPARGCLSLSAGRDGETGFRSNRETRMVQRPRSVLATAVAGSPLVLKSARHPADRSHEFAPSVPRTRQSVGSSSADRDLGTDLDTMRLFETPPSMPLFPGFPTSNFAAIAGTMMNLFRGDRHEDQDRNLPGGGRGQALQDRRQAARRDQVRSGQRGAPPLLQPAQPTGAPNDEVLGV